MSPRIWMYTDYETMELLQKHAPKVLLYGGYLGYNNFGDILQLKWAIQYHTTTTRLEPVVICHLASISDKDFLSRLRKWFGIRAFVFISYEPVEVDTIALSLVNGVVRIRNLHLYGGGFLNTVWGYHVLQQVEGVIENFGVDNYIISGQQIDVGFADALKTHFAKCRPRLVGVRDFDSKNVVASIGFPCDFSFDDASNIIEAWAQRIPKDHSLTERLFIHLNSSKYTVDGNDDNNNELGGLTHLIKKIAARFPGFTPVFLSAYSESRLTVRDTLATIISMEDSLPFLEYKVLDIAHMALLHDPSVVVADSTLALFAGKGAAISSSYHTAMFCNMLNTPCYLISDNTYYKQKRAGLGENRTFDQFLEKPSTLSYSTLMGQREDWLKRLSGAFEKTSDKACNSMYYHFDTQSMPATFRFKGGYIPEREGKLSEIQASLTVQENQQCHTLDNQLSMSEKTSEASSFGLSAVIRRALRRLQGRD